MDENHYRRDERGFLVRDENGNPVKISLEEVEAEIWREARDGNSNPYFLKHVPDRETRRKTVKIGAATPLGYAVINEEDFNPEIHSLFQEE